ncbi:MAG: ArsR family transcriptional regulator, partial [Deltaproteobacteria bacterium]
MKNSRAFKDQAYGAMARLVKALANPIRLEMIDLLRNGEKSVEEIARATGTSVANASQHLQILKKLNLVHSRKEGTFAYYSLANPEVGALWQLLLKLSYQHVPELHELVQNKRKRLPHFDGPPDSDRFYLLDVRP